MRSVLILLVLFAALTFVIPIAATAVAGEPAAAETGLTAAISSAQPTLRAPTTDEAPATASEDDGQTPALRETFSVLDRSTGETAVLSRTDLIRGMLASEMPFTFEEEALKAQAVAAHTWAAYNAEHPDASLGGADFSADPSNCEGYVTKETFFSLHGDQAEEAWQRICDAADYADRRLLLYDGEIALTAYHASSAGKTEAAENVWQTSVPYLVAVDSAGDLEDDSCEATATFGTAQMRTLLTLAFPTAALGDDPAAWITVLDRSESGYVTSVAVGGVTVHGQRLRTALSLRSTAFTMTYQGGIFTFETLGYGHGVGLSQVGANAMALEGYTAEEILAHYYPGTTLSVGSQTGSRA
jgi:stage II sporulation protein D